jgi:hypothetical protein
MANHQDINIKYISHIEIETDGTVPGTTVYLAQPGEPRAALACVVALAGGGESLEVPGLDADDPEIITLKVRGTVRRIPLRIFEPPFDDVSSRAASLAAS